MAKEIPRASSLIAMQSLLGNYGDEGDNDDVDDDSKEEEQLVSHHDDNISGSDDEIHERKASKSPSSVKLQDEDSRHSTPAKMPRLERKVTKLVSYGGDDANEDDDDDDDDVEGLVGESVESDVLMHDDDKSSSAIQLVDYTLNESHLNTSLSRSIMNSSADQIQLPPTPPGKCSKKLQDKVNGMFEKMKHRSGYDVNLTIQKKKDFRNPSIYEKLIDFCGINEKGTNYPPELYNPLIWGKDSYFDYLAKIQKEEMDKREKEKKERTKVEFVSGTKKTSSSSDLLKLASQSSNATVKQERKSKWDSQSSKAPASSSGANPNKTTVISAVGTLKKSK